MKLKIYVIVGALLSLAFPYIVLLINGDSLAEKQSLCPFKMLVGFPCPGCGITKSIVSFYQGEFLLSMQQHIFGMPLVIFCVALIVVFIFEIIYEWDILSKYLYNKTLGIVLGVLLGSFHLIRLFLFVKNNSVNEILKESIWK